MLKFRASKASLDITEDEIITSGRVGLTFEIEFSSDWSGLSKTVVCRCGDITRDVPFILDSPCVIPHECLTADNIGNPLWLGIYGANSAGDVVIPTIYANAGLVLSGAEPNGKTDPPPTPSEVAVILEAANEAKQTAQSVRDDANAGVFNGSKGDPGPKGDAGPQGEKGDKGATGEQGVSVTGSAVDESGHLILSLSDGSTIDAGVLPVSSVNGKTGAIELSALDIGAPTDDEFDTVSVLSGLDSLFSTSASAMFGTSGMDINIGISTQQPIYICIAASNGLSAGASITATPYWGGASMQTAYAATGMKLNRWYKIGHPMVGATTALPKINVKTDTGSMMTSSMNVFIRYTEVPGDTIDLTVAADAAACNAFVEKEVTSITTTNTPVVVSDAPNVSKVYIYLRYPGTPTTSQTVTATPVYSGADYSAGAVSGMKLNRWYALGVPAGGAALSAVKLKVNTGTVSSVTAVIRYDGNIDGNGVSY